MQNIVFSPDPAESDLEEVTVSFGERELLFKRGVARECPDDLADSLLKQPHKFKPAEDPHAPKQGGA